MKTLNQNNDSELIVIAPIQIKPHLSIGNIYDLTFADFYSKARKFAGIKVTLPLLLNVNGEPLIRQLEKTGIEVTPENIEIFIDNSVKTIEHELQEHYLNFDFSVRDDSITKELEGLGNERYNDNFLIDKIMINECLSCGNIFGSDPAITVCKICGNKATTHIRETLYKIIKKTDIESKINSIKFYPESVKKELENFVNKLPDKYNLILEKKRRYTLSCRNFKLDPRFTAIMLPAVIGALKYNKRIWIHGDVIKKFDYYTLCYLNQADCPTHIISHGVLQGINNKKLRWQDNNVPLNYVKGIENGILRAYFLKFNLVKDKIFDQKEIQRESKILIRLWVKIERTLEERNLDRNMQGIREELDDQIKSFNIFVENFKFHKAFICMNNYANMSWKLVKDKKISLEEWSVLNKFKIMFFGK